MPNKFANYEYKLPYLWNENIRKELSFIDTCASFHHMHIHGKSGYGKTRSTYEIIKYLKRQDPRLKIIQYNSHDNLAENNLKDVILSHIKPLPKNTKIADALKILLESQPVLLIIEDLQYTNDMRDNTINDLINNFPKSGLPLFLLTTSHYNWVGASDHHMNSIQLEKFSHDEIKKFINKCEKEQPLSTFFAEQLIDASDGHPLFLYESIKSISQEIECDISSCNDVSSLYCEILSHFNEFEQEIMRAASVIGLKFNYDEISTLLFHTQLNLETALHGLCNKDLLKFSSLNKTYSFTHSIQQESIKNSLDAHQKIAWHIELAQYYKKLKKFDLCGLHLFEAREYEKSIPFLSYTARNLLRLVQPKCAEKFFNKALTAYRNALLSEKASFFKLQLDFCQSLVMRGEVYKIDRMYTELEKTSQNFSNPKFQSLFLDIEIPYKWISAQYHKTYVLSLLDKLPNTIENITNKFRLLDMLVDIGYSKDAIPYILDFQKNYLNKLFYSEGKSFASMKMTILAVLANAYAQVGDIEKMEKTIKDCLFLLHMSNTPSKTIFGFAFCAKALHIHGKYEEAQPLIKRAYQLNRQYKIGIVTPDILSIYADNLIHTNEIIESLEITAQLMDFINEKGIVSNKAGHMMVQAEAFFMLGMNEIAKDILAKAMEIAQKQNNILNRAQCSFLYAKILIQERERDIPVDEGEILDLIRISKQSASDLGLTPLLEKCKKILP